MSLHLLLGSVGGREPEAARDHRHVHVDGNRGLPEPVDEDAVRGLRTHLRQPDQFVVSVWDAATVSLQEDSGHLADFRSFLAVEACGADEVRDLFERRVRERLRGVVRREEPPRGLLRALVLRALRQDRGDEYPERVLGLRGHLREGRPRVDAKVARVTMRELPKHAPSSLAALHSQPPSTSRASPIV